MIAVVDYKAGNLTSVMKAVRAALPSGSADPVLTEDPEIIARAEKVILPGVGHFAATAFLEQRGLRQSIAERIAAGIPFLGVCVGLQWLYTGSTESPETSGLGILSAQCERFAGGRKVPHVGWNSIEIRDHSRLLRGIPSGSFVYFTQSYRASVTNDTVAVTTYGDPFTAAAERGNVMGVQFHPEKSGATGLAILRNFLDLPC